MAAPKVSLRSVDKRFGATVAADRVDLDIEDGEFLTLLGASGCGKTTLMRIVAGFERPDAGRVEIDGRDVTHLPPRARRLGMVFQQYSLFPHLTVAENVGYGPRVQGASARATAERVDEMLALVRLDGLHDRRPAQLSGGQQQRVALARALATRPSVLMLDEPLAALDLKLRRQLQAELKRIHRQSGTTFLFVTHDQEEALFLSDRVAVMRAGRIEQIAAPDVLYGQPVNAFVADFVGDIRFLDGAHDPAAGVVRLGADLRVPVSLDRAAGPVRLAVRPEQVTLLPTDAREGLPAVVESVAQQVGTTVIELRLGDGQALSLRRLGHGAGLPGPGDAVRVRIATDVRAFEPDACA